MSDSTAVGTANWEEWTDRVSSWQDMTSDIPKMVREDISKARMMPQEAARGMKSLATDPLSVQYAMGYKDRKYSLTYDVLKRIPHQLSMIGAIINTRINQVSSFSVPYRASKSVGFVIKHKDPSHLTSKSEQKFIQDLEKFIYHCGHPEPNPHNSKKRDDFETFLKKIVRDSMTFDQACIELVPDRRGIPYEFVAVDASTIRIASPNSSNMSPFSNSHSRDPAYSGRLLQYMNNSSEERGSPYRSVQLYDQDDKPAYVQVMNGQIENVYTEDEMVFGVRNPRTDIYIQGYGYSELEQLITIITSHLYAEEYNRRFFMQGSAPKGVLNFKGDSMTPDMLEGFRRQWRANLEGVENCLSGDTCIYTAEQGFISLEEICGDRLEVPVHIWTGKSWETGLVYKTKEEKILCHTILDNGVTISSSPDHKFRVIGEDGKPVWCTQKELCDDDVVLVNKQDPSLDTELMCLGRKVTPEFMEVLGWFLGDGNVYYKTNDRGYSAGAMLSWFYNADTELDICDRHLEVIQEYFPQAYRYTHTRTDTEIDRIKTRYGFKSVQRTVESIRLHDKTAVKWFESHGFIQDHKKDIPNQLFLMPVDFRNAYLCGLFSADGNNAKGRSPELSCTSDQIRSQVRHLLLASGIRTSSSEGTFTKNPYSKKRINGGHKFSIKDRDSFFRDIGFLQDHKQPVKLKKASESNKYDYVPRSTVVNYLKRVREVNKESSYKLLTKQQRVNLNSILCGSDGCSKGRLIKYLYLVGLDVPAWLEDYHTAKVVDVVNTGIYVPMYDVSVNHSDHMFVGNNVLISNSWKTPILQSEQGVDWIDLHPSNREMEYNAWIEYLIKLSCFTENTPVTMGDGSLRPISAVQPGDLVYTHNGDLKPVKNVQTKEYDGPLCNIRAGSIVEATPEHPFYVSSSIKVDGVRYLSEPEWKNAEDIVEGLDYLAVSKKTYECEGTDVVFDLTDYLDSYKISSDGAQIAPDSNRGKWINRYLPLTEDVAYALGLYLAEGNSTTQAAYFTFSSEEKQYVDDIEHFAEVLGTGVRRYSAKNTTNNACIHSTLIARFLSSILGDKAKYKKVPKEIYRAPNNIKKSFFSGVFAGDGSVFQSGNVSATISLVSDTAVEQLRYLLLCQDIYSHKYTPVSSGFSNSGHGLQQYRLDVSGPQLTKLASWLRGPKGHKLRSLYDQITEKSKIYETSSYFFVPVSETWKSTFRGTVYNLEVEDVHTYQVNRFAVHNCAIFLIDPAELNFDLHGGVQQTPLFESSQEWKLKASRDRGLKPLLRFIAKLINENIISKIDDHFMFDFVGLDELTEQEKHTLRTEQVASYMTLNEIRRADDRHDLEYGDIPMNPTYIQAMQIKQQMEQQQQQQEQQQQMAAQQAQAPGTSPDEGTGMGPVGGPEEGEGDESPQYTDRFGKSLEARSGEKFLEIDLDLDSWKDDIRRD